MSSPSYIDLFAADKETNTFESFVSKWNDLLI
ncbi:MAG: hypothetical protein ACI9ON_003266, partial [Limisphaerales bacterium]